MRDSKERGTAAAAALKAITSAVNLDELRDAIAEAADHREDLGAEIDRLMTSLQTFGGEAPPAGTYGVWSWDADRVLVGNDFNLEILTREEWSRRGGDER